MPIKVAIAMPLYNEEDGIEDTLLELDLALHQVGAQCSYFIQNDCSTDCSLGALERLEKVLAGTIFVETNPTNLRHGPTTLRAYRRATQSDCDVVIQLDSDGQFKSSEVAMMLERFASSHDVDLIIGARKSRTDPWYRQVVTRSLRILLLFRFGIRSVDPNSPIRIARRQDLTALLNYLPTNPVIPNIMLTVLFHKHKKIVRYTPTSHLARRGNDQIGTMWSGDHSLRTIPKSLISLCVMATRQLFRWRVHR